MLKQRILIFYDHFYPAWKAGGPVQSLVNLVNNLHTQYDLYIICKPHEMNESVLLQGIKVNEWSSWEGKAKVYYWNYSFGKRKALLSLITSVNPHTVFINGLYSLYFNLLPLWYSLNHTTARVIWSARGMLHNGALAQKAFKKKTFLAAVKLLKLHQRVIWHATDEKEAEYISQKMGNVNVLVAGNYPKRIQDLPVLEKRAGKLILGTVALISPMKNHKAIAEALQKCNGSVTWLIYGPVKDQQYWNECLQLIQQLPANIEVTYRGELAPDKLTEALQAIHVFIMPSESENFGHALYEALSAGKPVITTTTTPFYKLQEKRAGFAVSLNQLTSSLTDAVNYFLQMEQVEYDAYCMHALTFAQSHISIEELSNQYQKLLVSNQ